MQTIFGRLKVVGNQCTCALLGVKGVFSGTSRATTIHSNGATIFRTSEATYSSVSARLSRANFCTFVCQRNRFQCKHSPSCSFPKRKHNSLRRCCRLISWKYCKNLSLLPHCWVSITEKPSQVTPRLKKPEAHVYVVPPFPQTEDKSWIFIQKRTEAGKVGSQEITGVAHVASFICGAKFTIRKRARSNCIKSDLWNNGSIYLDKFGCLMLSHQYKQLLTEFPEYSGKSLLHSCRLIIGEHEG